MEKLITTGVEAAIKIDDGGHSLVPVLGLRAISHLGVIDISFSLFIISGYLTRFSIYILLFIFLI
jgi:hypothetical protein